MEIKIIGLTFCWKNSLTLAFLTVVRGLYNKDRYKDSKLELKIRLLTLPKHFLLQKLSIAIKRPVGGICEVLLCVLYKAETKTNAVFFKHLLMLV